MTPLLLTETEAMARLGIRDRAILLAEINAGYLRFVQLGKRRRYTEADLEEFIRCKREECRAEAEANAKARRGATSRQGRAIGITTSGSRVCGIEEARRRIAQSRPKRS